MRTRCFVFFSAAHNRNLAGCSRNRRGGWKMLGPALIPAHLVQPHLRTPPNHLRATTDFFSFHLWKTKAQGFRDPSPTPLLKGTYSKPSSAAPLHRIKSPRKAEHFAAHDTPWLCHLCTDGFLTPTCSDAFIFSIQLVFFQRDFPPALYS